MEFRSPFCSTKRVKTLHFGGNNSFSESEQPEPTRKNQSKPFSQPQWPRGGSGRGVQIPLLPGMGSFVWFPVEAAVRTAIYTAGVPPEPHGTERTSANSLQNGEGKFWVPDAASSVGEIAHVCTSFPIDHLLWGPRLPGPLLWVHQRPRQLMWVGEEFFL
jgi:hypothetical protein